jgi:hypothetical protein
MDTLSYCAHLVSASLGVKYMLICGYIDHRNTYHIRAENDSVFSNCLAS